jgi:hypothetical protein
MLLELLLIPIVVVVVVAVVLVAGPADVILALHACGAASDYSLQQAAARKAAYIVSPCCIGKVKRAINKSRNFGNSGSNSSSSSSRSRSTSDDHVSSSVAAAGATSTDGITSAPKRVQQGAAQAVTAVAAAADANHLQLHYPRSAWLTEQLRLLAVRVKSSEQQQQPVGKQATGEAAAAAAAPVAARNSLHQALHGADTPAEQSMGLFAVLAQAADYSHVEDHGYPELAAVAKSVVELDRQLGMVESGYSTSLVRLLQPELTSKSDVLVGAPTCSLLDLQHLPSDRAAVDVGPDWHTAAAAAAGGGSSDQRGRDVGGSGSLSGRFTWPWTD